MSGRHATDVMSVKVKCSDRNKKTGDHLEIFDFKRKNGIFSHLEVIVMTLAEPEKNLIKPSVVFSCEAFDIKQIFNVIVIHAKNI